MRIKLTWIDPNTGEKRQPSLETPIAIGRELTKMPAEIDGRKVSRMVIQDDLITDYHALIDSQNQQLMIYDQSNGKTISIDGEQLTTSLIQDDSHIQIGICTITVNYNSNSDVNSQSIWECDQMIGFLFKRRCGRTDTVGCVYCQNQLQTTSSYEEYSYYEGYGNYSFGHWGGDYYKKRGSYSYDTETGNVDFTEADAGCFEIEGDGQFETDMGAS